MLAPAGSRVSDVCWEFPAALATGSPEPYPVQQILKGELQPTRMVTGDRAVKKPTGLPGERMLAARKKRLQLLALTLEEVTSNETGRPT